MLITENTKKELDLLVQRMFILNRFFDRAMSVLSVKFAMNKFVSLAHPKLAHRYPILADEIAEMQERYNVSTIYLETPKDDTDYQSPKDFFARNLKEHVTSYEMIKNAISIANSNKDYNVEKELNHFMVEFNKYMEQAILWSDKVSMLKNEDWFVFDYMSNSFFLFGDE